MPLFGTQLDNSCYRSYISVQLMQLGILQLPYMVNDCEVKVHVAVLNCWTLLGPLIYLINSLTSIFGMMYVAVILYTNKTVIFLTDPPISLCSTLYGLYDKSGMMCSLSHY